MHLRCVFWIVFWIYSLLMLRFVEEIEKVMSINELFLWIINCFMSQKYFQKFPYCMLNVFGNEILSICQSKRYVSKGLLIQRPLTSIEYYQLWKWRSVENISNGRFIVSLWTLKWHLREPHYLLWIFKALCKLRRRPQGKHVFVVVTVWIMELSSRGPPIPQLLMTMQMLYIEIFIQRYIFDIL